MREIFCKHLARIDKHEMQTRNNFRDILAPNEHEMLPALRVVFHIELQPAQFKQFEAGKTR